MSNQPPYPSQTSAPPGHENPSQSVPRSSTLGPSLGSVSPLQMPDPVTYQPQQQAPYASAQSTQPHYTHQTFNASASAPPPPHTLAHPYPPRPLSNTPSFPSPFNGGHPPTNPGPPDQHYNVPGSHLRIPQEPQPAIGGWGRDDRSEADNVNSQATRNEGDDERVRAPPRPPSAGRPRGAQSRGCCTVV